MPTERPIAFETRDALDDWLKRNHDKQTELWVRIYKKASGKRSVDWGDCVVAALAWGGSTANGRRSTKCRSCSG
jgi:hypothetical protein